MRRLARISSLLLLTALGRTAHADDAGVGPNPSPVPARAFAPAVVDEPRAETPSAAAPVVKLSGYVQAQYQYDQSSSDQLAPGGTPLNQNHFVVRRGRLRVTADWQSWQAVLELDGNTVRGPAASLQRAELTWRAPGGTREKPWLAVTAGLTDIPFGDELTVPQDQLPFLERSAGSQAFFTGPRDVGVRIHGTLDWFRYDLAAMNGAPLDERGGLPSLDPASALDLIGRLGVDTAPSDSLRITGGISYLTGRGFSPGTDASKAQVVWRDFNGDGQLSDGELVAVPATAAVASSTFDRWAVGVDVAATLQSALGVTKLALEGALGDNIDRGLFVADPVLAGRDQRGVTGLVALTHDLPWWVYVGVRASLYRPDLDLTDPQRGVLVPASPRYDVISPVLGVRWSQFAQLVAQGDFIFDTLGRNAVGTPADAANNRFTLRAQVRF